MGGKFNTTYDDIKNLNKIILECSNFITEKNINFGKDYHDLRSEALGLCNDYKVLMDAIIHDDNISYINAGLLDIYISELKNFSGGFLHATDGNFLKNYLKDIISSLRKILNIMRQFEDEIRNNKVDSKIAYLDETIKNVSELTEQVKNLNTHDIYEKAAVENQKKSDNFRMAFILLIMLSIVLVWFCSITQSYFGLMDYNYWFFKGTLVLTSITLITYFLKESVKYQKMADQCKQTKLELEAFPSFVASFTTEDPKIIEIRRELALKYFGRDLINNDNDNDKAEASNVLTDQMKNTTELVKATTEAIKNLHVKGRVDNAE